MKVLLIGLLLGLGVSCGKSEHEVKGIPSKIEIVHSVDMENFEEQYIAECEELYPDDSQAQEACVDEKMQDLTDLLNNLLGSGEESGEV